jgi:hypothetical protein
MRAGMYEQERKQVKWDAWDDFRREVAEDLYHIGCNGKSYPEYDKCEYDLLFWSMSEEARGMQKTPYDITSMIQKLEYHRDVEGVQDIISKMYEAKERL